MDPVNALKMAAIGFLDDKYTTEKIPIAMAFAELSVTGRHSLEKYLANTPTMDILFPLVSADPAAQGRLPVDVEDAINRALTHAQHVLQVIMGDTAFRKEHRSDFEYIAVSGEDDLPLRPINVESTPFPQYDLVVTVPFNVNAYNGKPEKIVEYKIQTRYMIASSNVIITKANGVMDKILGFPTDPPPSLPPNGRVFLYIHGHMSGVEEALDLTKAFHSLATADSPITVISVDLPGMSYATSPIDDLEKFPFPERMQTSWWDMFWKKLTAYPTLDFIEKFIFAFVDTLDSIIPLKAQIAAVIGGSLGGHMGLRLSRRANEVSWLISSKIVTWSPISAAPSIDGTITGTGTKITLENRIKEREIVGGKNDSRINYFKTVYTDPTLQILFTILPTQPKMWYRDDWKPCQSNYIADSHQGRREVYRETFRIWHWRTALECAIFSFHDPEFGENEPRYLSMNATMLLASGSKDDFFGVNIFTNTRILANLMVNTMGTTLFLLNTGHSIHNERPKELAKAILDFVNGTSQKVSAPGGFCQFFGASVVACLSYSYGTSESCQSWADEGSNQCCDWIPCSWACQAYYWIANWVCQAYYWIANWVCQSWTTLVTKVCNVFKTINTWICE